MRKSKNQNITEWLRAPKNEQEADLYVWRKAKEIRLLRPEVEDKGPPPVEVMVIREHSDGRRLGKSYDLID